MSHGVLYADPTNKPLSPLTSLVRTLPSAIYVFYVEGTTTAAIVYSAGDLSIAYPSNIVQADVTGTFPAIFLDPSRVYRVQMFDQFGRRLMDVDPYIPPITTLGTSPLSINTITGEVTVTPNTPGGTGAALTVIATQGGIALNTGGAGFSPGQPEIQLLNTGLTGTATATFTATNKPGSLNNTGPTQWMPLNVNGALFYMPLWT